MGHFTRWEWRKIQQREALFDEEIQVDKIFMKNLSYIFTVSRNNMAKDTIMKNHAIGLR